MKRRFVLILLSLVVVLTISPDGLLAAGEKAVPQVVKEVFKVLDRLERSFESGRWDEAKREAQEVGRLFPQVAEVAQGDTPAGLYYDFGYSLGMLQVSLSNRDRSQSTTQFIEVQNIFLKIADAMGFEIPPSLQIVERYLSNAQSAMERGDYVEVVFEMKEIGRYFRNLHSHLEERGVDQLQLWGYHQQINRIMAAAEESNREQTEAALRNLDLQTKSFVSLFTGGSSRDRSGALLPPRP